MMRPLNAPIKNWTGKRVWVVGASSGIGAALAKALLDAGAWVTLSARRQDLLQTIAAHHGNAHVVAFDAGDKLAWQDAFERTLSLMGHIDLVVLGAARYDPTHSWELDLEHVQKSYDLNVVGVYSGVSVLVPYFLKRGEGGLAVIASISAYTGLPKAVIYGATKAALNNMAQTLYFELQPKGLSVYLVNPGFVETPMTAVNDFDMPGLMKPVDAAKSIMAGFERGDFEIRFPRGFAGALRWLSFLPDRLRFPLLHKITNL
ncbi:SDR family NAD(P)-dependent oxidoreductase [Zwartia vadi]|uniref:SDR family NAD(P)-dependent oxidoreductase n=1 Tax=Zwartia vadi TaxID=3058168 RepID=UPI0025B405A4|nr:SDR family NAD(P)-dependent oxidoreductase [Zwartia vadi]MDN3988018.1 SDR family NAD(P)-dependent oxidoreductase [Zwartia vadi]